MVSGHSWIQLTKRVTSLGVAAGAALGFAPCVSAGEVTLSARSLCAASSTTSGAYTTVRFASPGTCEWTVPAGVTVIDVLAVGGGGSGGWGQSATSVLGSGGGGGGGGGGQRRILAGQAVTPGAAMSITVGAGGNNAAGGDSGVGSLISATGGSRGGAASFYSGGAGGTGGTGGTATNGRPGGQGKIHNSDGPTWGSDSADFTFAGASYCTSGGGGGGYLTNQNGGQAPGGGCTSARVGGYGAGYSSGRNEVVQPTAGASNSGGGGGGGGYTVGSSSAGAAGGSGLVVIAYSQAGLTPILSATTPAGTGFTFQISNYDAAYGWTASATAGSVSVSGSTVTVTGLPSLTTSTVTVSATRTGYANASSSITGQQEAVAQTVSWSPSTSITTLDSPHTPSAPASTNGGGVITYSRVSNTTATCAVDPTTGSLTYSGAGTCVVRATAAATPTYASGFTDVTFTSARATASLTWNPSLVQVVPSGSTTFAAATSNSDGVIDYAVSNPGTTGCSVVSGTRTLSFTAEGSCDVVATVSTTGTFDPTSSTSTFVITKAAAAVTWTPVTSLALPGATVVPTAAVTTGDGAVTYSVSVDTGTNCSVDPVTGALSYSAIGQCQITATSASTTRYLTASTTVTFTVTAQAVTGGSGGSAGSDSGSSSTEGLSRPGLSALDVATQEVPTESNDHIATPGSSAPTRGRALPPRPRAVQVTSVPGRARSMVAVEQRAGVAGSQALATVIVVRNQKGSIVSRISIALVPGQGELAVTVPFVGEGYSVNVYNVNELGVSDGALVQSSLVHATTISARSASGTPALFGTPVGDPIMFAGGSAALDASDRLRLRTIARSVRASQERLFITGFARRGGGSSDELAALSTRRARVVAGYLAKRGVQVWTRYWGAGSLNGSGAPEDRRVEVRTSAQPIPRSLVPRWSTLVAR